MWICFKSNFKIVNQKSQHRSDNNLMWEGWSFGRCKGEKEIY